MKKVILLLLLFVHIVLGANTEKVRVLMPVNFLPFAAMSNGVPVGMSVDIFKETAKIAGIEYEIIIKPTFLAATKAFINKEADMLLNNGITEERKKTRIFTSSFASSNIIAYKLAKDDITSLDNISTKNLILKTNNAANKFFKNHPKEKLRYVDSKEEAIVFMLSGESDIFIFNEAPMTKTLKLANIDNLIVPFGDAIKKIDLAFAIQKDKPELAKKLDKALQEFMQTDKFKQLYAHYILGMSIDEVKSTLTPEEKNYLANNTFTFCGQPNVYPLSKIKDGKLIGMMGDYMEEIVKHTGLKYNTLHVNNRKELKQNVKDNKCDILGIVGKDSKAFPTLMKSNVTMKFPFTILGNLKSFNKGNSTQLSDYKFIVKDKIIKNNILNIYPNLNIEVIENIDEIIPKVKANMHFIGTKPFLDKLIQEHGYDNFKINGVLDGINLQTTIGIYQAHPMLHAIINKTIAKIDPLIVNQIYDKYSIKEFKLVQNYFYLWYVLGIVIAIAMFGGLFWVTRSNRRLQEEIIQKEKTQKALKENEQKLRTLFDTIPDIVWFKDTNGLYQMCNEKYQKMMNSKEEEMLGKSDYDFLESSIADSCIKSDTLVIETRKLISNIEEVPYTNAETKILNIVKAPVFDFKGKLVGVLGIGRDITELKRNEEMITKQSRHVAMGEMIAMIAHQWRQPLSIISTSATGMKLQKEWGNLDDEDFFKSCDYINRNAQYLSKTIDDFRNFIKGDRVKSYFNLDDTINSFLELISGSVKNYNIKVIVESPNNININGYESELIQCLMNIYNNSKDALIDLEENEDKFIFITLEQDDNNAFIKIKDNAKGIKNKIIPRIFEPYFTTKTASHGTGLGLHMTFKIIEEGMNGTIQAKNVNFQYLGKEYIGAEFILSIPKQIF